MHSSPESTLSQNSRPTSDYAIDNTAELLKESVKNNENIVLPPSATVLDSVNMLTQLKNTFNGGSCTREQQIQILTFLPIDWSEVKIMDHFNCTKYMIKKAKEIKKCDGVLAVPKPKRGLPTIYLQFTHFYIFFLFLNDFYF